MKYVYLGYMETINGSPLCGEFLTIGGVYDDINHGNDSIYITIKNDINQLHKLMRRNFIRYGLWQEINKILHGDIVVYVGSDHHTFVRGGEYEVDRVYYTGLILVNHNDGYEWGCGTDFIPKYKLRELKLRKIIGND